MGDKTLSERVLDLEEEMDQLKTFIAKLLLKPVVKPKPVNTGPKRRRGYVFEDKAQD